MEWVYHDGGRAAAGFKAQKVGDCVTRSIAIATGLPYRVVYDELNRRVKTLKNPNKNWNARTRLPAKVYFPYLEYLGWVWHPTMFVGKGCIVHLRKEELPPGKLLVEVSKHMTCVIDGVIYDNHDPTCGGERDDRCVYGYFQMEC